MNLLMKKYLLYTIPILLSACDYKSPEKDRHPEIPNFSEKVLKSPEKFSLKPVSANNEDVTAIFIDKNKLILVSEVRKNVASADSIVISEYNSFEDAKKFYYIKGNSDSTNFPIDLYKTDFLDGNIYATYHKFSAPDYKPELIDSAFIKKRDRMKFVPNFADNYNSEFALKPFEEIVVGNTTNCGGGKLGGPIVCPVYLNYYKIDLSKKSILFKELEGLNQFKVLTIFGKRCLFYHSDFRGNSRLFLIEE